jgi:hypothetical protein
MAEAFLNGAGIFFFVLLVGLGVDFGVRSPRIPDRFRQHCVKLALGEFLGLPRYRLTRRHNLIHRAGTGRQQPWLSLRSRHDLGLCGWRLVPSLQAHAQQLGAHRIAAAF